MNTTWHLFASRSARQKNGIQTYYYLVENKRENGKVKQKVLKYLGTKPNKISVDLTVEQCTAILGSSILSTATSEELKRKLPGRGICVPSYSCKPLPEKYEPEERECPNCGVPLQIKKAQKRRLVTPAQDTKVVEVIKRCNCSNETFVSKKKGLGFCCC